MAALIGRSPSSRCAPVCVGCSWRRPASFAVMHLKRSCDRQRLGAALANSMPGAGFEPARGFPQGILSPSRLPISPPRPIRRADDSHGGPDLPSDEARWEPICPDRRASRASHSPTTTGRQPAYRPTSRDNAIEHRRREAAPTARYDAHHLLAEPGLITLRRGLLVNRQASLRR